MTVFLRQSFLGCVSFSSSLSLSLLVQYIHKIAGFLTHLLQSGRLEKWKEGSRKLGFERGVACAW